MSAKAIEYTATTWNRLPAETQSAVETWMLEHDLQIADVSHIYMKGDEEGTVCVRRFLRNEAGQFYQDPTDRNQVAHEVISFVPRTPLPEARMIETEPNYNIQ